MYAGDEKSPTKSKLYQIQDKNEGGGGGAEKISRIPNPLYCLIFIFRQTENQQPNEPTNRRNLTTIKS